MGVHRRYRGLFFGTQRHGDTENIIKFSEDTESFFRTPWLCPAFFSALPFSSALPFPSALYG